MPDKRYDANERITYRFLGTVYAGTIGIAGGICLFNLLPMILFHYEKSISVYQRSMAVLSAPWTSQALVGAIADDYPIRSWHKRYYLIGAIFVFAVCLVAIGSGVPFTLFLALLLIISTTVVFTNSLSDGHTATLKQHFNFPATIIPYTKGCEMFGSVLAAVFVGVFAENHASSVYYIGIPFALAGLFYPLFYPHSALIGDHQKTTKDPLLLEQLTEEKVVYDPCYLPEWRMVKLLCGLGIAIIIPLAVSSNALVYLTVGTIISSIALIALVKMYQEARDCPAEYVFICTYVMFHEIFGTPNIRAGLDGFYTLHDTAMCSTGGPQFDILFYYSTVSAVTGVGGVLMASLMPRLIHRYDGRTIVQCAVVVGMISGLCDLSIVMGYAGEWSKIVFIFGDGVIPAVVRVAQETVTETMAYASIKGRMQTRTSVFYSFRNLGTLMSYIYGLVLTEGMGVRGDVYGCTYVGFAKLILAAKICVPWISIGLAYFLLPNNRVGDI